MMLGIFDIDGNICLLAFRNVMFLFYLLEFLIPISLVSTNSSLDIKIFEFHVADNVKFFRCDLFLNSTRKRQRRSTFFPTFINKKAQTNEFTNSPSKIEFVSGGPNASELS